MIESQKKTLTAEDLRQFTGSERWFRHNLARSFLYTEGVQYMAEHGEAYWLVDEIILAQGFNQKVNATPFQFWTLKVNRKENSAKLICTDGGPGDAPETVIYSKSISYTDFPLDEIKLYLTNNTLLLPSEY